MFAFAVIAAMEEDANEKNENETAQRKMKRKVCFISFLPIVR
jgi:hypothetical protein